MHNVLLFLMCLAYGLFFAILAAAVLLPVIFEILDARKRRQNPKS